jgi:hypothetical protein
MSTVSNSSLSSVPAQASTTSIHTFSLASTSPLPHSNEDGSAPAAPPNRSISNVAEGTRHISKRKRHSGGGEYAGINSQPRKKQKTRHIPSSKDVSLAELVDFAQMFKPHTPLDVQSARMQTSGQAGGRLTVPRTRCDHLIHPAYSNTYKSSDCPRCSFAYAVSCLEGARGLVQFYDDTQEWLVGNRNITLKAIKRGAKPSHHRRTFWDQFDNDLSYRHSKKRLANEVLRLEQLAEQESKWEQHSKFPWENQDQVEQRHVQYHDSSAKATLELYWTAEAEGQFTRIEDRVAMNMLNHGRDNQIAAEVDYPDDETTSMDKNTAAALKQQQTAYIKRSNLPIVVEPYNSAADVISPPKRHRRNIGAKVSFDPEVKVCLNNDIDVLRKQVHANTSTKSAEGVTYGPPRSILRTVAPYNGISSYADSIYGSTKLPYTSVALKTGYGMNRHKEMIRRQSSSYIAGAWPAASDSEYVDTSGEGKQWGYAKDKGWNLYIDDLQDEADRFDVGEYFRLQEAEEEKRRREQEQVPLQANGSGFTASLATAARGVTWLYESVSPFMFG